MSGLTREWEQRMRASQEASALAWVGGLMPPRDIEIVAVRAGPADDECIHGWSLHGIPPCARCFADRKARDRYSEAVRRGQRERQYVVVLESVR